MGKDDLQESVRVAQPLVELGSAGGRTQAHTYEHGHPGRLPEVPCLYCVYLGLEVPASPPLSNQCFALMWTQLL